MKIIFQMEYYEEVCEGGDNRPETWKKNVIGCTEILEDGVEKTFLETFS